MERFTVFAARARDSLTRFLRADATFAWLWRIYRRHLNKSAVTRRACAKRTVYPCGCCINGSLSGASAGFSSPFSSSPARSSSILLFVLNASSKASASFLPCRGGMLPTLELAALDIVKAKREECKRLGIASDPEKRNRPYCFRVQVIGSCELRPVLRSLAHGVTICHLNARLWASKSINVETRPRST